VKPTGATERSPNPRRPVIVVFASHWLAMLGLGLILTAMILWLWLLPIHLRHGEDNPYAGVATLTIGAIFALGLVLTPLGLVLGRRRLARGIATLVNDPRTAWHRLLGFLLAISALNIVIASQLGTRAAHAMESRQFCTSCHVMEPEGRAFEQGPHAGLLCVDCHVGEGAVGLVKSMLQGAHQMLSVLRDSVEKPF